jgi:hypothetical protein
LRQSQACVDRQTPSDNAIARTYGVRCDLHPVCDEMSNIPDLYLVEVRVPGMQRAILFSTGGGDVFIKTDAGKKKLSPLAIQLELAKRLGIDLPL